MKKLTYVLILFLLVGCNKNNYDEMQQTVISYNQRVERVINSYEISKQKSKLITEVVKEFLVWDMSEIHTDLGNNELERYFIPKLVELRDEIVSFINTENLVNQELEGYNKLILDYDFLEKNMEVYYFLDDLSGVVEQMFIVTLPRGVIKRISLYWLEGAYIDAKILDYNWY